jgi:hypothetical protein
MTNRCSECGAPLAEGQACLDLFHALLELEFHQPAYWDAHFFTVSTYMIQHGQYSDEALVWIRGVLRRALDEKLRGEEIRRLAARASGNEQRTWKVTRAAGAPVLPRRAWTVTAADVLAQADSPDAYIAEARRWARSVLEALEG